ncbi:hypothetical protein SPRG_02742 [Saprolegnia parasitica CBS 223.65]|uniref:F-box domain-containing protein n=1 Tax=Saprolegnia parasitica (strain CBS 223.65) TaxID=695850 RepID=A0A067CP58_SAPPC|nr:hypothetical protein SPRG_02742 [Saprolegnia parasitica CBS 223.65]KDO32263.1 hypothetical protein SPRG_02742 [Saprolegnia parasitica CBS 223.65]|eukprot:XP_012196719.1 hypothetical protein SPRG_02742 [Saprolegnia parasitica CBS 223.65]
MQDTESRSVRPKHAPPMLLPEILEVIVEHLSDNATLRAFLTAWPEKHLTLPLQALRQLLGHTTSQLRVAWPIVHVLEDNLDEQTMDYLYGTFPLSPQIHIEYPLGDAADLDDVLQDYGPCLAALKLYSSFEDMDDVREMRSLLLSVPHLRRLEVHLIDRNDATHGLSLLLQVLEHPTLTHLTLANGEDPVEVDIAFSHQLLKWLQTRRVQHLSLENLFLATNAALPSALSRAIAESSQLQALHLRTVDVFESSVLHGYALPTSVTSFEWEELSASDSSAIDNLVAAIQDARALRHLACKNAVRLLTDTRVRRVLSQLTSLTLHNVTSTEIPALVSGLQHVPGLKRLHVYNSTFQGASVEAFLAAVSLCRNLEELCIYGHRFTATELGLWLVAVPRWPQLRSLALASHRCSLQQCLSLLPAIAAAAKHLTTLDLANDVWSLEEKNVFWRELATVARVEAILSVHMSTTFAP